MNSKERLQCAYNNCKHYALKYWRTIAMDTENADWSYMMSQYIPGDYIREV